MTLCASSAEWYEQSSMLIKAYPRTTRITSKYSVLKPTRSKIVKRQKYLEKRKAKATSAGGDAAAKEGVSKEATTTATEDPASMVSATFTLKTYDDRSGILYTYQTDKAAEVGRLVGCLGRLGRAMAALPEAIEDFSLPAESGTGIQTPALTDKVGEKDRLASPAKHDKLAGAVVSAETKGKKGKKKGKK